MQRLQNGITIRRLKKKRNMQHDARIKACMISNAYMYSTHQFLRAISHRLGAHTKALDVVLLDDSDADDDGQQQQPQQQQGDSAGSTTHSLPTFAMSASSLHDLGLLSCHAAIPDSASAVQRLWQQWTAADT